MTNVSLMENHCKIAGFMPKVLFAGCGNLLELDYNDM